MGGRREFNRNRDVMRFSSELFAVVDWTQTFLSVMDRSCRPTEQKDLLQHQVNLILYTYITDGTTW